MASQIKRPKFVIGLGASAGGLDALEQFFDHAPLDSGAAFVVVMHLSRDFKSMLDELLARRTSLKVTAAMDGEELEADTVYVIQPSTMIEIDGLKLKVEKRPAVDETGVATAVDLLFASVAKHWGERGGAIVFSGSGSDGAKGIRAVRDAGGFTCAQSPETAKFDPMPSAAIATESVNAVESPDQLATTIIEGLQLPLISREPAIASDHELAMRKIVDAVIGSSSIKAREYKHSTFERRVSRRMMDLRIKELAEYADRVTDDPEEAQRLSQELLIGVTDFFRDEGPYEVIRQQLVPQLIQVAHQEKRPIRIWIAGCATGEEVYSIAILFREAMREMPFEIDVQLFATDVSKKHIAESTRGRYSTERVSSIPRTILERYFTQEEESGDWTVIKRVRQMVVFAQHDLLSDPPFTKLDMVCCRNVLIYFSIEAQQRILGGFAFGLHNRGFLVLGSSETVGGQREAFEFIDAKNRIFRRTQTLNPARHLAKTRELFPHVPLRSATRPASRVREAELQPAYAALLAEYAPAGLLISADRQLAHSFGDANKYLRTPTGVASLDITELVDPSLKTPLIAALERASKQEDALTFSRIVIEQAPEKGLVVDLTVRPLPQQESAKTSYVLAVIDERKYRKGKTAKVTPSVDAERLVEERVIELENELARTREALQSTIEEIETANEELQASNEELMSANEELQSTNEELSSVNEELYSVNAEYHRQNNDLNRLTHDFDLLLNATQIGVLFLDEHTRITRFTGLAKDLFKLEDRDIDRPLGNFSSPFEEFDPDAMREQAKGGRAVVEVETADLNGAPWLIRLVMDEDNFGVVVAFIDIGELRDAEQQLRQTHRMLESIRTTTHAYFFECDPEMKLIYRQVGFDEFIGVENMKLPFAMPYTNVHPGDVEMLHTRLEELPGLEEAEHIYRMFNAAHGTHRYIRAVARKLPSGNWEVTAYDVDDIYRAEVELRQKRAILDATLSAGRSYQAFVDQDGIYQFANPPYLALLDLSAEQVIGQPLARVLPPALYAKTKKNIESALGGEKCEDVVEVTVGDGKHLLSVSYRPVNDGDEAFGFVFDGIDISELEKYSEIFSRDDRIITAVTRNSDQPVLLVDVKSGNIQFANDVAEEMLGLASGAFVPDTFKISRLTPEVGDKRWLNFMAEAELQSHLMLNDVGVFDGVRSSAQADIYIETELASEDRVVALVRVIENREKTGVLEDLRERSRRLASSNRDLEQFTTAVAHDLRAPLRHITSFAELLDTNVETLEQADIKRHAEIIGSSARSLSNMVSGLLDYARIGMREKEMSECGLSDVVAAAERNLAEEAKEDGASIEIVGDATISGNFELLTSLFQNLIANAIKYRKPDQKPHIVVAIEPKKDNIRVTVSDNGIGIDPDYSDKIFELFKRLHLDAEYEGLGIGLATCRKIVELHNADISLDPDYANGSRFVIDNLVVAESLDVVS